MPQLQARDLRVCEQAIAANLERVQNGIAQHAGERSVKLVCVTKYARDEWVRALLLAGATDLGENMLPHAADRFKQLKAEGYSFQRHLIGAQQSRKLKMLPGNFDLMHAIDRWKTADVLHNCLLAEEANLDCLLQVNIGDEEQKKGVDVSEVKELFLKITEQCPAIRLRGLMAIPPGPAAYPSTQEFELGTRKCFEEMRGLFDTMRVLSIGPVAVDTLSLGMSQDYLWAVAAGATLVRVGSALFEGLEGSR